MFAIDCGHRFLSLPRYLPSISFLCIPAVLLAAAPNLEQVRRDFARPPADARILMRWWWFGPAVKKAELQRELEVMQKVGIGGVEIQPVYPLELDDAARGIRNDAYLSPAFLDNVRFTAETAKRLGLRVDVTLGSGWPYGGPQTPVTEAASRLRCDRIAVAAGASSVVLPAMENGEELVAVFVAQRERGGVSGKATKLIESIENSRVHFEAAEMPRMLLVFVASRTGQQVKRASVGADGFVLDHFDAQAVKDHLQHVADRLLTAFGGAPPYAVFSDSLEVFGTDWTPGFLKEFEARRGYDLKLHLPELVADVSSPETASIRHDWAQTLTELAEEHYLTPIREWAHAHHTLFRSQTYGEPPVYLSSNELVDLPEGEAGPRWRTFSTARWAASASHLFGRPVTSTETWTWLHSPAFRATPLDMKAEADLHFLQGINQLVGHGWPYSPAGAGEPGQRFYAAAAFNDHNPWYGVMPDVTGYLQRMSYLLRQGKAANDIAVYLPTDDALASSRLGHVSIDRPMGELLGAKLIPAILDSGYNFDFIDDRAMEKVGVPYRVLLVPGAERMPQATLQRIESFVEKGGIAVATRRLPSKAPGWRNADTQSKAIEVMARKIFGGANGKVRLVADEAQLGEALHRLLPPDLGVDASAAAAVGFIHRVGPGFDIYFIANTTNQPVETGLSLRGQPQCAEHWDPYTGRVEGSREANSLSLAPYESEVLIPCACESSGRGKTDEPGAVQNVRLDAGWQVTFTRTGAHVPMDRLRSWTELPQAQYYSGEAIYEKSVRLPRTKSVMLDFGAGEAVTVPPASGAPGMRALLEGPVREGAVVFVNGKRAGSVWHPPYRLDVSAFVREGMNELRMVVGNTAVNEMAGQALPNYRLLNQRYGERFVPQGFEHLEALPSGLLNAPVLEVRE